MPLEFERRFLVSGEGWKPLVSQSKAIRQGYLSSTIEGWTVRIRIDSNKFSLLTLKSPAEGIGTHEFEYKIPLEEAEQIWELSTHKLTKERFEINLSGGSWIVDCFKGKNFPLVIAEIELASSEETIEKPAWCGQELTGAYHWSNASLAKTPISDCSIEKRLLK